MDDQQLTTNPIFQTMMKITHRLFDKHAVRLFLQLSPYGDSPNIIRNSVPLLGEYANASEQIYYKFKSLYEISKKGDPSREDIQSAQSFMAEQTSKMDKLQHELAPAALERFSDDYMAVKKILENLSRSKL